MLMIRPCTRILISLFAMCALFCACGGDSDVSAEAGDNYSERCYDQKNLEGFQADFGNYRRGQTIPFLFSDGLMFPLAVSDVEQGMDEVTCRKYKFTWLESSFPIYSIKISAYAPTFYYNEVDKLYSDTLRVTFGQYVFTLDNPEVHRNSTRIRRSNGSDSLAYNPDSLFVDTMMINGVKYTDVAVSYGRKYESVSQTKLVKADARLYYQAEKGILKIDMEDGSSISIREED